MTAANINAIPERAFARLAKLLPLRSSPNREEADTARRRIDELLAKWGISEDGATKAAIGEVKVGAYAQSDSWRVALASGLAVAYGCRMYQHTAPDEAKLKEVEAANRERIARGQSSKAFRCPVKVAFHFIGRPSDTALLVEVFQEYEREIERLCVAEYARLAEHLRPQGGAAVKWYNGFRHGAALALVGRAKKRQGIPDAEDVEATLARVQVVPQTGPSSLGDMAAFRLGMRAAKTIAEVAKRLP